MPPRPCAPEPRRPPPSRYAKTPKLGLESGTADASIHAAPGFPTALRLCPAPQGRKRPKGGGLIGGGNLPSRGGGTAMRPATQASGTEGTQTGDPASTHAGAARVPLPCHFPTPNRGTRGREGTLCGSGLGKIRSFGKEETDERGEVNGEWKGAGAARACNAMPTKGRGEDVCDGFGSWWRRLSPLPRGASW